MSYADVERLQAAGKLQLRPEQLDVLSRVKATGTQQSPRGGGVSSPGTDMSKEQLLRTLLTGQASYQAAPGMLNKLGMVDTTGTPFAMTALEGLIGSAQQGRPPEPGGPPVGGYMQPRTWDGVLSGLVQETVDPGRREELMRGLLGYMEKHKNVTTGVDQAISGFRR